MKTILITFPFGISARNVICARVAEKLREKGFCVVIIAPHKSHVLLRELYPDKNIILETYPKYESFFKGGVNRGAGFIEQMLMGLINASLETGATKYRRRELLFQKRYFRFIARWIFQKIFNGHYSWSEYFRKLDERYFPDKWFGELFEKYKPCAVFSPHVQFDFNLIKRANAEGVLSFGQILSIDNLTTKGNIRAKSDYLFVWNDIMKNEAIKYNLYKTERVIPIGIPQYEIAYNKSGLLPRNEFCKRMGIDPKKHILLYASEAGDSPDDVKLLTCLTKSIRSGKIIEPLTIIARPHPRDYINPFESLKDNPEIKISDPRTKTDVFIDRWYPSRENIDLAANLLYHASVVMVTVSTMGLDACAYGRPVIAIGFDMKHRPIFLSPMKYYKYFEHQRYWLDTGAYKLVKNTEELIQQINTYLKYPEQDQEKRKELVNKLFYKFDGHVGDRIVNTILNRI